MLTKKKRFRKHRNKLKKNKRKEQETKQRQMATPDFPKTHFNISRIIIIFENQLRILVKTAMEIRVPLKAGNLFSS